MYVCLPTPLETLPRTPYRRPVCTHMYDMYVGKSICVCMYMCVCVYVYMYMQMYMIDFPLLEKFFLALLDELIHVVYVHICVICV